MKVDRRTSSASDICLSKGRANPSNFRLASTILGVLATITAKPLGASKSMAKLHIITTDEPATIHVSTSETLDNGVLWEASLVNGGAGVTLNTGHPYYPKAYLPNKTNSVVIQALDFLLWSLAQAELNNISDDNRDAFEEFRIEVSRNLKKLVADLPDAIDDETE